MTGAAFGSGLFAGLAILMLLRPSGAGVSRRERPAGPAGRWWGSWTAPLVGVSGAVTGGLLVSLQGTDMALGLVVLGVAGGVGQLVVRGRRRRAATARRTKVVELGEALGGELRAGRPPAAALARAAEVWPPFTAVVVAARLDADVPAALRRLSRAPGAEGLLDLASAWQVAERAGAALGSVVTEVVESARARHAAEHAVRSELASAQATARLVALLPLVTLGFSSGLGSEAWTFLLSHPLGLLCLAVGSALVIVGLHWIDRIATTAVSV